MMSAPHITFRMLLLKVLNILTLFYLACLFFLSHITFVINEENIVEIIFTTTHLCFHVCFVELLLMKSYLPRGGAASE